MATRTTLGILINLGTNSKVVVKPVDGKEPCPLYKFLTSKETNPKFAGEITWNFEKFLVGRNGEIVARFAPTVTPDAPEVVDLIEANLPG